MVTYDTEGYDSTLRSISHRGYSAVAPENTLPAYILAKTMGFRFVETDVSYTADGVPMLLHDATIDRTSDGSGRLSEMTYAQVRQYDFGSWKSMDYAGTVIPTLDEFLLLCEKLALSPYIELKRNGQYTREQIEAIVDLVKQYGIGGNESYISFSPEYLEYVKQYNPHARLGYLKSTASTDDIDICRSLKTSDNQVFYDVKFTTLTEEICRQYQSACIPLEVWTVNTENDILSLDPYISGVTSDSLIAGKVLSGSHIPGKQFLKNDTGSIWKKLIARFKR